MILFSHLVTAEAHLWFQFRSHTEICIISYLWATDSFSNNQCDPGTRNFICLMLNSSLHTTKPSLDMSVCVCVCVSLSLSPFSFLSRVCITKFLKPSNLAVKSNASFLLSPYNQSFVIHFSLLIPSHSMSSFPIYCLASLESSSLATGLLSKGRFVIMTKWTDSFALPSNTLLRGSLQSRQVRVQYTFKLCEFSIWPLLISDSLKGIWQFIVFLKCKFQSHITVRLVVGKAARSEASLARRTPATSRSGCVVFYLPSGSQQFLFRFQRDHTHFSILLYCLLEGKYMLETACVILLFYSYNYCVKSHYTCSPLCFLVFRALLTLFSSPVFSLHIATEVTTPNPSGWK